jgi:hypothetical protein
MTDEKIIADQTREIANLREQLGNNNNIFDTIGNLMDDVIANANIPNDPVINRISYAVRNREKP